MLLFVSIAVLCLMAFVLSLVAFDDINLADALDFGDDGGAGWFSLRAFLMFGLGFGAIGAISMSNGATAGIASLLGLAAGAMLYAIGVGIAFGLSRETSDSTVSLASLIGREALVIYPIHPYGTGEVEVSGPNGTLHQPARTNQAEPYAAGTRVTITGVTGNTLWVKGV